MSTKRAAAADTKKPPTKRVAAAPDTKESPAKKPHAVPLVAVPPAAAPPHSNGQAQEVAKKISDKLDTAKPASFEDKIHWENVLKPVYDADGTLVRLDGVEDWIVTADPATHENKKVDSIINILAKENDKYSPMIATVPCITKYPHVGGVGQLHPKAAGQQEARQYSIDLIEGNLPKELADRPQGKAILENQKRFLDALTMLSVILLRKMWDTGKIQVKKRNALIAQQRTIVLELRHDKDPKVKNVPIDDPDVLNRAFREWINPAQGAVVSFNEVTKPDKKTGETTRRITLKKKVFTLPKGVKDKGTTGKTYPDTPAGIVEQMRDRGYNYNTVPLTDPKGATIRIPDDHLYDEYITQNSLITAPFSFRAMSLDAGTLHFSLTLPKNVKVIRPGIPDPKSEYNPAYDLGEDAPLPMVPAWAIAASISAKEEAAEEGAEPAGDAIGTQYAKSADDETPHPMDTEKADAAKGEEEESGAEASEGEEAAEEGADDSV